MTLKTGDRVYFGGDTDGNPPHRSLTGTVHSDAAGMFIKWDSWRTKQRWHIDAGGGGLSQPQRTCFRVELVKESRS